MLRMMLAMRRQTMTMRLLWQQKAAGSTPARGKQKSARSEPRSLSEYFRYQHPCHFHCHCHCHYHYHYCYCCHHHHRPQKTVARKALLVLLLFSSPAVRGEARKCACSALFPSSSLSFPCRGLSLPLPPFLFSRPTYGGSVRSPFAPTHPHCYRFASAYTGLGRIDSNPTAVSRLW